MSVGIYLEIERRFLVNHNGFMATERPNINKQFVVQGFWGKDQQISIFDHLLKATHISDLDQDRLRRIGAERFTIFAYQANDQYFLLFKNKTSIPHSYLKFEYELSRDEFSRLIIKTPYIIFKTRHIVPVNECTFLVDIHESAPSTTPLVTGQLRIPSEDSYSSLILPSWVQKEFKKSDEYDTIEFEQSQAYKDTIKKASNPFKL